MTERIAAVILDWAGTVVDHGSLAPMGAFVRAFAHFGVDISVQDARGPMGMAKRDHIAAVVHSPAVAASWAARHARAPGEADIDAIFAVFEPMNVASVIDHAGLISGAAETIDWLGARGIRVGSTTGYTRPIMERLLPVAAAAGYAPEIVVCAGDLPAGRPSPLMMWYALARMGVWPAARVVKVDDTPVGIGEGRNAGTWTVGVALTGNLAGLTAAELARAQADEVAHLRSQAASAFASEGAHLVVDSIADLPGAIATIEGWMAEGRNPGLRPDA